MDKRIKIGIGVMAALATVLVVNALIVSIAEKKQRKKVQDPSLPKGTDEDLLVNYGQKIGATIYPSGAFANIRASAKVNDGFISNFLWKVNSPSPIGIVQDIVTGEDGKEWYRFSPLTKPSNHFRELSAAYVRSDVVTFTKK